MNFSEFSSPIFSVCCFVTIFAVFHFWYKNRNIPPGPWGLPFVGFAPFLGPNAQLTFLELGKKYGKIFSLKTGPNLTIVLNDFEAIQAAFVGQAEIFSGRADTFIFRSITTGDDGETHGIAIQEGEIHKITRKFMLQTFKELGKGRWKPQDHALDEAKKLTFQFAMKNGKAFDPFQEIHCSVSNVVRKLCLGEKFEEKFEEKFRKNLLSDLEKIVTKPQIAPLQMFPFLRFLPGFFKNGWENILQIKKRTRKYLREAIDDHRKTLRKSETRDFVDAFLHQQTSERASKDGEQPAFRDEELFQNVRALIAAGSEPAAVTLQWALLFMLHHPDVQKKIHQKLDACIGTDHSVTVTMKDRIKLPYVDAVIHEIQRMANVLPFGVLRTNREETTLLGFRIPKRCYILPNYLAVNLDQKLWKNPFDFNPDRFLNDKGALHEPAHFMPYALGKRSCIGEGLARMELFLFFANILQRFEIRQAKNSKLPLTTEFTTGVSCRPLPFQIEAVLRS